MWWVGVGVSSGVGRTGLWQYVCINSLALSLKCSPKTALACTYREWCSVQACVCVRVSWAYFMPAIQAWEIRAHTQCHLALVHILAFLAPRMPNSHSQVIQFPFLPLWLDAGTNLCFPEYRLWINTHRYQISLCPPIWELCLFDIIFPAETTCNYGLHSYCGKITNCRLLRMKLSHMLSRVLVVEADLTSSTGTHTSSPVIKTCCI